MLMSRGLRPHCIGGMSAVLVTQCHSILYPSVKSKSNEKLADSPKIYIYKCIAEVEVFRKHTFHKRISIKIILKSGERVREYAMLTFAFPAQ